MYYQQGTVISSEVYMHRKREHRNKKKTMQRPIYEGRNRKPSNWE